MEEQELEQEGLKKDKSKKLNIFGLYFEGSFEVIPAVLIGIITLSTIYINSYYYLGFKFKVSSYLDISEIILISFVDISRVPDIAIYFILQLAIVIVFILNWSERVNYAIKTISSIILQLGIPSFLFLISSYGESKIFFYIMLIINFVGAILIVLNYRLTETGKSPHVVKLGGLCWIVIISTLLGQFNYESIVKGYSTYGTTITTNDFSFKSDSTFFYVGKTKNYVFMWNAKLEGMTVIPMSDIKKLELFENVDYKKYKEYEKALIEKKAINKDTLKKVNLSKINFIDTTKKLQK